MVDAINRGQGRTIVRCISGSSSAQGPLPDIIAIKTNDNMATFYQYVSGLFPTLHGISDDLNDPCMHLSFHWPRGPWLHASRLIHMQQNLMTDCLRIPGNLILRLKCARFFYHFSFNGLKFLDQTKKCNSKPWYWKSLYKKQNQTQVSTYIKELV